METYLVRLLQGTDGHHTGESSPPSPPTPTMLIPKQDQVDAAPPFSEVLEQFERFLVKNGLIDENGQRLLRFCWCSDGPFDVRDFIVKQCFISKVRCPPLVSRRHFHSPQYSQVRMPTWLLGDVLDIRSTVLGWMVRRLGRSAKKSMRVCFSPLVSIN